MTSTDLIHLDEFTGQRVALLEDHGLIAHTLAAALRAHGLHVDLIEPTAHEDLVTALVASEPQVILLDLDLGSRGSSIGLIMPLTAHGIPVAMLTGVTDPVQLARCVAAGAVGVLDKSGAFDELLDAIGRLLKRGTLLNGHEREEHLARLRAFDTERQDRLAPFERLTPREIQVLAALMRGSSVEDIARAEVVSVTTIRTHVRGVLTKLGVTTQLAATAKAIEAGWRAP